MRNKKRLMALVLAVVFCFAFAACGKNEPANNSPLPPAASSQPEQTPVPTQTPEPTPEPTAEPTPTPSPAPYVPNWKAGYYEKNGGSAAYIALDVSFVGTNAFNFSIDAKGISVSGTATFQPNGTARYEGDDCTLVFTCLASSIGVSEEVSVSPNIVLSGNYVESR